MDLIQSPQFGNFTTQQRLNIFTKKCRRNRWNFLLLKRFNTFVDIFITYGLINERSDCVFFKKIGQHSKELNTKRNERLSELMQLRKTKPALIESIDLMMADVNNYLTMKLQ